MNILYTIQNYNNSKQKNAETIDTKLFTFSFHMTKPANTKLSYGLSAKGNGIHETNAMLVFVTNLTSLRNNY